MRAESYERARQYSRLKDRLALISISVSFLTTALFLFGGGARRMNQLMLPENRVSLARRLSYTAALSALGWVASLPLWFFSGHIIERRYGLSNQNTAGWMRDAIKAKSISTPFELAVIEGVYVTIRRWPRHWWLLCSAAAIPLTAALAQLFPVLIAPRFNRYEPLRDRDLAERVQRLAADGGIRVAEVLQMDMSRRTSKANAFFAGIGKTKRIVLSDTLLEQFTPEQIEGIVAHEIAHQVHGDIWRFIGLSGAFTIVTTLFVDRTARQLLEALPAVAGTNRLAHPRSLPVLAFATALVSIVLTPIQLAYSRNVERSADRFAMRLTDNPRAYANALRQLAISNLADPNPPAPIVLLLHSHPPLAERIEVAENMEYQQMFGTL